LDNSMVRAEDIIWRRIGDEIVVIKDDGLSVHLLNKTAALIWEMCADTSEPDKIAAMLCERFEISLDEARGDVEGIIEKMEKIGLIKQCVRLP
jgi:hypothetical protein